MNLKKDTYDKLIKKNSFINTESIDTTYTLQEGVLEPFDAIVTALGYYKLSTNELKNTEGNWNKIQEALQFLDAKIVSARKTATFWDAYNISTVARTREEFSREYGKLAVNSGLLIDSAGFSIGNTTYKRGDIVFKTNDNQQIHIKSAQTGYYEPTTIEVVKEDIQQTNTCKITYKYKSGSNDFGQATVQLKNFSPEAPDNGILYNEKYTLLANEAKKLDLPKKVAPIYDVRLQLSDGYGEKIINAVTVSYNADMNECTFTNNSSFPVVVLIK